MVTSTTAEMRADAAALEALLHPRWRRRAGIDALDRRGRKSAGTPAGPRCALARRRVAAARRRRRGRLRQRCAGDGRDFARDAEHRQAIGAIRRELEREQRVVELERARARRRRSAHRRSSSKQPGRIVGDAELAAPSTACPATRRRASPPCVIVRPPGSTAPTCAHGTFMPAATLGAPQTIDSGAAPADVDAAHRQTVGVRMPLDGERSCRRRRRRTAARPARALRLRCRPSSARRPAPSLSSGGSTSVRSQCSENFMA